MLDEDKPDGCTGYYIPWICGVCKLKRYCKPGKS